MAKREILTEVVAHTEEKSEFMHIERRHKFDSTYPLHRHKQIELNYIAHAEGLLRVIGDSSEEVTGDELVLIGANLEHQWAQPVEFIPHQMDEITIQFSPNILSAELLSYQHMKSLRQLMEDADRGVRFSLASINKVRPQLEQLASLPPGFDRFILLLQLLYVLSDEKDYVLLSSEQYTPSSLPSDSSRLRRVTDYIAKHYNEEIRLETLSAMACMTPTSFSRFFRLRTHMSISDYIINKRLNYAAKLLAETQKNVSQISCECGFNNITNFNRIFKSRKAMTPNEFRRIYSTRSVRD